MKKMKITSASYWLGSAALLSLFVLNGCAGSSMEVRYDDTTKTYSTPQNGAKSTVGKYDGATARYTLRQGGTSAPQSEAIKTISESDVSGSPMVIAATDVLFEFDKWVLKKSYFTELDRWVDYFQNNPVVTAEIYGHTDSTGPTTYNQKLSEKRAQAVVNYLVNKGIDSSRLTPRGFGESQPKAANTTKEGRQKNRRVEVDF